jgi:hypothetical protein
LGGDVGIGPADSITWEKAGKEIAEVRGEKS